MAAEYAGLARLALAHASATFDADAVAAFRELADHYIKQARALGWSEELDVRRTKRRS